MGAERAETNSERHRTLAHSVIKNRASIVSTQQTAGDELFSFLLKQASLPALYCTAQRFDIVCDYGDSFELSLRRQPEQRIFMVTLRRCLTATGRLLMTASVLFVASVESATHNACRSANKCPRSSVSCSPTILHCHCRQRGMTTARSIPRSPVIWSAIPICCP